LKKVTIDSKNFNTVGAEEEVGIEGGIEEVDGADDDVGTDVG